ATAEAASTEAASTEAASTEAASTEAASTEAANTEATATEAATAEAAPTKAAPTEAASNVAETGASETTTSPKATDGRVRAVVRTVLQWGVFVSLPDYGDIEGIVHMTEASHNRGAKLENTFSVGQEVEVKVLRIDDKAKLWLSRKALEVDPWAGAAKKYAAGSIHHGKVVRLTDFGAFVELEPGIDGLCHVADLSLTPIKHPKEAVNEGQDFEVVVANVDPKAKKVTLHPAPPADERDLKRVGRLSNHAKVKVVVTQIRDAGLGVRILGATGRHARGFIPASQTGTTRGTDLRKHFPLGTKLDVKVIDADSRRGETRLSIRALKDDAEKHAYREYRKKVQRESGFGTFADLLKDKL
ncbi:MAG: S1 RNA-binding domain-containing protein, partial [Myxococcota bacterium]